MLVHRDKVAFYVTGQDGQGNVIAMGGGPVCDIHSSQYCGDRPGDVQPIWENSLSWYQIREEFEPVMDIDNSTITGHDDREPLHPGIAYWQPSLFQIQMAGGMLIMFNWLLVEILMTKRLRFTLTYQKLKMASHRFSLKAAAQG